MTVVFRKWSTFLTCSARWNRAPLISVSVLNGEPQANRGDDACGLPLNDSKGPRSLRGCNHGVGFDQEQARADVLDRDAKALRYGETVFF